MRLTKQQAELVNAALAAYEDMTKEAECAVDRARVSGYLRGFGRALVVLGIPGVEILPAGVRIDVSEMTMGGDT